MKFLIFCIAALFFSNCIFASTVSEEIEKDLDLMMSELQVSVQAAQKTMNEIIQGAKKAPTANEQQSETAATVLRKSYTLEQLQSNFNDKFAVSTSSFKSKIVTLSELEASESVLKSCWSHSKKKVLDVFKNIASEAFAFFVDQGYVYLESLDKTAPVFRSFDQEYQNIFAKCDFDRKCIAKSVSIHFQSKTFD